MTPMSTESSAASRERRPRRATRDQLALVAAVTLPLAVAAILVPFRDSFSETDSALVMVVVIVGVAVNGSRTAGYVATISAGLWFDFFLTRPYEEFTIASRAAIETEVLLVVVGVAVTELAVRSRQHRSLALEEARMLDQVHSIATLVADGEGPQFVIMQVAAALTRLLHLRDCRFDSDLSPPSRTHIEGNGDVILAGGRWPTLVGRQVDLIVRYKGVDRGRFVLTPTPGYPVSVRRRRVAVMLADLAGASLR
jgi:K+-sensing histidine kinase KdpD